MEVFQPCYFWYLDGGFGTKLGAGGSTCHLAPAKEGDVDRGGVDGDIGGGDEDDEDDEDEDDENEMRRFDLEVLPLCLLS
jgi:hypothetical protein